MMNGKGTYEKHVAGFLAWTFEGDFENNCPLQGLLQQGNDTAREIHGDEDVTIFEWEPNVGSGKKMNGGELEPDDASALQDKMEKSAEEKHKEWVNGQLGKYDTRRGR